jgi:DNA-binding NtrC family response regulator
VAREDDVAKRRDATRARGVAKQRAVAKDQVASGRTIQVDEVATGDEGAEAIKADLTQADEVTTGIEVTEVKPDMTQGDNMTEVPDYSQAGKAQLDATTAANPCATILQAIVAEATEYSKKSIDDRLAFVEKLLGAKSLDTVIQIQSDFAKTSYEDFVAQTKKLGELYSDLAKAAFKPFDVANVQGTKQ